MSLLLSDLRWEWFHTAAYTRGSPHDPDRRCDLIARGRGPDTPGSRERSPGASLLHLPPGAFTFASRKAHKLAYRAQRETPGDRALGRAFKLRRRLGSQGGIGEEIEKPKGMRWKTFDREIAKVEAAEAVVNGHTWLLAQRLDHQFGR